ncbi:hypothetical protein BW35_01812 [Micrococcus luteus]|nr:hypothetical protein BW35_01812 [Micrococcus luteus]
MSILCVIPVRGGSGWTAHAGLPACAASRIPVEKTAATGPRVATRGAPASSIRTPALRQAAC